MAFILHNLEHAVLERGRALGTKPALKYRGEQRQALLQAVDSSARDDRCGICTIQARCEAAKFPPRRQRMAALAAPRGKSLPLGPSSTGSRAGTTPRRFNQGKSHVVNPKFDIRVIGAPSAQYPYAQP
jgi:hypothetical protein